jgi:hypothetical protein
MPTMPPQEFYDWMTERKEVLSNPVHDDLPSLAALTGAPELEDEGDAQQAAPGGATAEPAAEAPGNGAAAEEPENGQGEAAMPAAKAEAGTPSAAHASADKPGAAGPEELWQANAGGQKGVEIGKLLSTCQAAHGDKATWTTYKCAPGSLQMCSLHTRHQLQPNLRALHMQWQVCPHDSILVLALCHARCINCVGFIDDLSPAQVGERHA